MRLVDELRQERDSKVGHSLYWWTQVEFAYNSNHMEGSTLTSDQTAQLYETGSVLPDHDTPVRKDDMVETSNHFLAFNWILDHVDDPVTEHMILTLQRMLRHGTRFEQDYPDQTGHYKTSANVIATRLGTNPVRTAPPDAVPALMRQVIDAHNNLTDDPVRLAGAHWMFEAVHPFLDGNGRVGRLLLFKQCLHLDTVPPLVLDQDKLVYDRGLNRFPDEPGYLVDSLLHARDVYENILDQLHPAGVDLQYNNTWDAASADISFYKQFREQIAEANKG